MYLIKSIIEKSQQYRAPEGGIVVNGKFYEGGEFVPREATNMKPVAGIMKWNDPALDRPDLRKVEDKYKLPAPKILNSSHNIDDAIEQVAKAVGVSKANKNRTVATPAGNVIVSYDKLHHTVEKRSDERERYANYILPTLEHPYEVWEVPYEHGVTRKRYIGLFHGQRDLMVSVSIEPDGTILWNFMQESHAGMNRQRIGNLAYYKK